MAEISGLKRPCRLLAITAMVALFAVAAAAEEARFAASGFRYLDSDDWASAEDPLFFEENFAQHMRALTSFEGITWPSCQSFYGLSLAEHDYCLSLDPSNCFYGNCPSPSPSPSASPKPSPSAQPPNPSPSSSPAPQPSPSPKPNPGSNPSAPSGPFNLVAKAMDGYMANCTVFLDLNDDGVASPGEPIGLTDKYGTFNAPNVQTPAWMIFLGVDEPYCKDSFTGLPAVSRMEAAPGSTVVNPLTTVVAVLMASGASQQAAELALAQSLGLPAGVDLSTFDPISATATGTAGGSAVLSAITQLQTVIAGGVQLLKGASGASQQDCALAMYAAIVGMVKNGNGQAGARLDLTDPTQLQTVIASSVTALQNLNVTGSTVTLDPAVISAAASGMSSVNALVSAAVASGANSTDFLVQIARLGLVAQGSMASQMHDLATGVTSPSDFVAANTGDALNNAVATTRAPGETLIGEFVQQQLQGPSPAPAPTPTPVTPPAAKAAGAGSAAIIIGCVVGGIVLLSLLGGAVWYVRHRNAMIQPDANAPLNPTFSMAAGSSSDPNAVEPIRGQAGASAWDASSGGLRQRPGLQ